MFVVLVERYRSDDGLMTLWGFPITGWLHRSGISGWRDLVRSISTVYFPTGCTPRHIREDHKTQPVQIVCVSNRNSTISLPFAQRVKARYASRFKKQLVSPSRREYGGWERCSSDLPTTSLFRWRGRGTCAPRETAPVSS